MERELKYLLADLCVKWGFCISSEEIEKISRAESYFAEEFGWDLVAAEGMNPDHETKWIKKIARIFRMRFGGDSIHVSTFVDRVRGQNEVW